MEATTSKKPDTRISNTYFTCTLDKAAAWNARHPKPFEAIIDLLDHRADTTPHDIAVGFPIPPQDKAEKEQEWSYEIYG